MTSIKDIVIRHPGWTVGIDDHGGWVVEKHGRLFGQDDLRGLMPFVFLLEEDLPQLRLRLRTGLLQAQGSEAAEAAFPYSQIAAEAIGSGSPNWISRGMRWLDHIEMCPRLEAALKRLVDKKDGTQAERQQARRRLKQEGLDH